MNHEDYMREALKEAKTALKEGNWPIGCVIVLNKEIITRTHNLVYTTNNKLNHAEMLALQQAQPILRRNKRKASIYTTYEPCPMCFGGIILSRIKNVYAGIDVDNSGAMYLRNNLPLLFKMDDFQVNFRLGILERECYEVFRQGKPTQDLIRKGLLKPLPYL